MDEVRNLAPVFGGINLEDIATPGCFEVEEALQDIGIPVMDQRIDRPDIKLANASIFVQRVLLFEPHQLSFLKSTTVFTEVRAIGPHLPRPSPV